MNERIRQLAEQAGISLSQKDFSYYWVESAEDIEKFAALIVRECSLVVRNGGYRKGAFGNEDLRPSEIATMIEEHFGVNYEP